MRLTPKLSAAVLAIGTVALSLPMAAMADEKEADVAEMTKGEIRLAKLLKGREAGEPVSCIRHRVNDRVRIIDNTAIVYGRGNTIYVNYTRDPSDIDRWDTMVTRRFGSSFCKSDIVTTIDQTSGIYSGNIFLDDFIPYKRVKTDES